MRISDFRRVNTEGRDRISARVSWEDCARSDYDLFFEVPESSDVKLTEDVNPFLVGAMVPALFYGEQRIFVDGTVCPEFIENLNAAVRMLKTWYYDANPEFRIECRNTYSDRPEKKAGESGLFFSGGVDSVATLQLNRMFIPRDHPRWMRKAIIAFGLELDELDSFNHVIQRLGTVARECELELVPVYTNVYLPYRAEDKANGFSLWLNQFNGPALAAIGHACSGSLDDIAISATLQPEDFGRPYGSHPLIDEKLSSSGFRIRHVGLEYTRLQKIRLVLDCKPALRGLRVCNQFKQYSEQVINCERCEKCIRTKLALIGLGALDGADSFAEKDVSVVDIIERVHLKPFQVPMYTELLPLLRDANRLDLVSAVENRIAEAGRPRRVRKASLLRRVVRRTGRMLKAPPSNLS